MISFPTCKINLGLNILSKRKDGYHEVNTLMIPVSVKDVLEIIPAQTFDFTYSGLKIPGNSEDNLIFKAYEMMKQEFDLPPVKIHLYKNIPMGGGLGGGSSNGAFTLKTLNTLFDLKLDTKQLQERALKLGSDCPFFIEDKPQIAKGRGEVLSSFSIDLKGKHLLLINNGTHISTAEAYGMISPKTPTYLLENVLNAPMRSWKNDLINDFEGPTLNKYPELTVIKKKLYEMGAVYAAMTGSGSTLFGIFDDYPEYESIFKFPNGFVKCVPL
ncbi:MAG TPA: 4-(cytidine 5'-diphospho)-2-C-methyl-D-erythritol kinase [Brumimicrobium sp.]|nr:4-(cytidine 5'-diphospho)-2-C-methyl-D-erythritol kinase [Brumimicrobium sp.]